MSKPIHQLVKETHEQKGLQAVFRDVLGWDTTSGQEETFATSLAAVKGQKLASLLNGVVVFSFDFSDQKSVSPSFQKEISRAVGERYAERLIVINNQDSTTWLWPKKTSSGTLTHEKLIVPANSLPLFLAQRLAALRFTAEDHMRGISVQELREKLRGSFDTSTVTKKFYDRFKNQHQELAASIKGLSQDDAGSYATLLLNRLMFIYFLQKKEFLNSDPNYLRTCLRKLQELDQSVNFYNFYRDLLLVLFFEGLNKKERDFKTPQIRTIIGQVPYVNGGIFGETELERNHQIEVPDAVFESIFDFFDSFTWHLDTRPTGKADEINPEVIGYIFEQYINFTAGGKKENGAYYTKQDVTGYMVGQTLVPRILDVLVENGMSPLALVPASKDRYIFDSMLHGWNAELGTWHAAPDKLTRVWVEDPIGWHELDEADLDPILCLPGESWVEMFHRRDRVEKLRIKLSSGEISEVNELITLNLNGQLLLLDAIQTIDSEADLRAVWERLSTLSVIDPTCGSGAFLFAALEILEDVYSAIVDVAEELSSRSVFAQQLIDDVAKHPNRRYFIRKKASLSNLYGTDLMPDAIETAKLRIFLALASCLDAGDEIEPLPDLDFNLKVGNLLVGIANHADITRFTRDDLVAEAELRGLAPEIESFRERYTRYVALLATSTEPVSALKEELETLSRKLGASCSSVLANLLFITDDDYDDWLTSTAPMHWLTSFPGVIETGGFDVLIGNPPYIRQNASERRAQEAVGVVGFETKACPDIYARCFERALHLLKDCGRLAFIVPINLAYSNDFEALRNVLARSSAAEWWSTYDQLPQGLFEGAAVRNTLFIHQKGGASLDQKYSSHHQIFTVTTRPWLFPNLQYSPSRGTGAQAIIRGGILNPFLEIIREAPDNLQMTRTGPICMKSTANYWVPVSPKRPKILDQNMLPTDLIDPKTRELEVSDSEDDLTLLGLLSGKLGFLWWQATGDGLDTIASTFRPLRAKFAGYESKKLLDTARLTLQAGLANTVVNFYMGKNYVSIRWAGVRRVSDSFDRELLDLSGQSEYWRAVNIVYRQVMRSNDSRQVGQELAKNSTYWDI